MTEVELISAIELEKLKSEGKIELINPISSGLYESIDHDGMARSDDTSRNFALDDMLEKAKEIGADFVYLSEYDDSPDCHHAYTWRVKAVGEAYRRVN